MFVERLQELADRIEGVHAISLVAKDGIPVESVSTVPELDLEMLAAELVAQVQAVATDHEELSPGPVRHLAVLSDRLNVLISSVTDDFYFLAVLAPGSNLGRARFELRRAVLRFEGDLVI